MEYVAIFLVNVIVGMLIVYVAYLLTRSKMRS